MRDGTEGIMAKIIIGLICIVFALFGFGSITTFLAPVAKVATVNGEDITQQAMEVTVERRRRMLMARDTPIDEDQLREDVLNSLITRAVLTQAAAELNLHYNDAELDAEIVTSPVFMLDGQFNAQQFQQVIGGAGFTPLTYRAEMRADKLFGQMITGIQQSAFITQGEAKRFGGLLAQRRDIAYIQILASDLIDQVEVSDEEVTHYYNANLSNFVTDETVDLQYIELSRDELAASYEIDELALQEYFDENKTGYSTDESRHISHILIETTTDLDAEAARQRAESVYQRIVAGEDFSAAAQEASDDQGSRQNGGDLGFNQRGIFSPDFESVAFSLAVNQVSEPVKTDFGFHIIKVHAIEEAVVPELADVRGELEQTYRYAVTEDEFVSKSSRMAEMLFENFSELESVADALGLEVRSTGHLKRDADHSLMSASGVSAAAF
ncbi:MAG: SurA N-terminal domain-containing protein, partial [Pseudomonadales bacterium]|nr:SurA N-terminal domain-containing protein [Pseudomonadales bacterium]